MPPHAVQPFCIPDDRLLYFKTISSAPQVAKSIVGLMLTMHKHQVPLNGSTLLLFQHGLFKEKPLTSRTFNKTYAATIAQALYEDSAFQQEMQSEIDHGKYELYLEYSHYAIADGNLAEYWNHTIKEKFSKATTVEQAVALSHLPAQYRQYPFDTNPLLGLARIAAANTALSIDDPLHSLGNSAEHTKQAAEFTASCYKDHYRADPLFADAGLQLLDSMHQPAFPYSFVETIARTDITLPFIHLHYETINRPGRRRMDISSSTVMRTLLKTERYIDDTRNNMLFKTCLFALEHVPAEKLASALWYFVATRDPHNHKNRTITQLWYDAIDIVIRDNPIAKNRDTLNALASYLRGGDLPDVLQTLPMLHELGILTQNYEWIDRISLKNNVVAYTDVLSLSSPILPEMS